MGWFTPADNLSDKAKTVLTSLAESCQSEYAAVADCLNTIAENDEESAADLYLVGCAEQIIEAAQEVIKALKPALINALVAYAEKGDRAEKEHNIIRDNGAERSYLSGLPYLWSVFGERAFVFASVEDAQWFIDQYPEDLQNAKVHTFGEPT